MSDDLKARCARFYEEVLSEGNYDAIDELVDPGFVDHEEFPGTSQDRDGIRQFVELMRRAFPDLRCEVEQLLAEGDTVVARATMRGTHEGELMGVPGSGRAVAVQLIDIVRFADGKAVEHWGVTDGLALMEQIGAMEPATA